MSSAQDVLMSTERVAEHLDDDSIRIVDVDEDPAVHSEAPSLAPSGSTGRPLYRTR